jgi:hypothetical protein
MAISKVNSHLIILYTSLNSVMTISKVDLLLINCITSIKTICQRSVTSAILFTVFEIKNGDKMAFLRDRMARLE